MNKDRERINLSLSYSNEKDLVILNLLKDTVQPNVFIKQLLLDYANGKLVYHSLLKQVFVQQVPVQQVVQPKEIEEPPKNISEEVSVDEVDLEEFYDLDIDLGI